MARFCPECGNRIYHYDPDNPGTIKLKPANLHDTRLIKPTAHIGVSRKQQWFDIRAGVKQFDKQPSAKNFSDAADG